MAARTSPSTVQELWQQEMDEYGDQLPLLLQPGETVRGLVRTNFGRRVKQAPVRYVETGSRGWKTLACFLSLFDHEASDLSPIGALLRRLPATKHFSGGWRSEAGQFVVAADRAATLLRNIRLLVTDRRVLVFNDSDSRPLAQRARVGEYRRDQLRLRPGAPRKPGRGVDLGFPDGSWVRMTGGALSQELLTWLLGS
jgi:hypothetical protein